MTNLTNGCQFVKAFPFHIHIEQIDERLLGTCPTISDLFQLETYSGHCLTLFHRLIFTISRPQTYLWKTDKAVATENENIYYGIFGTM